MDGGFGYLTATEHLGDFGNSLLRAQNLHPTGGALWRFFFFNFIMGSAQSGYLWQMGDADYLTLMTTHFIHDLCHLLGYLTTHTRINLVEDNSGQFHSAADHCFQG